MITRIITAQGPIQLLSALSVLEFQKEQENTKNELYKDYLIVTGLYSNEQGNQNMAESCFLISNIWNFQKKIYLAQKKWESLCVVDFSHAKSLLKQYLKIDYADLIYVTRNWQPCNELLLATFENSLKICYGDGIGLLDIDSNVNYINPNGKININANYLVLPVDKTDKTNSVKTTIVPESYLKNLIIRISKEISQIQEIYEKELAEFITNSRDKKTVLVTLANGTESGAFQDVNTEINVYLSCIFKNLEGNEAIIIKGHPREIFQQSKILANHLIKLGYQVLICSSKVNAFSIEIFFPFIPRIDLGITLVSSTAKSLPLFYQCDLIIGLGKTLIENNVTYNYQNLWYFNEYVLSLSSKNAYQGNGHVLRYKEIEENHNFQHIDPIKIKLFRGQPYIFCLGQLKYSDKIIEIIKFLNLGNNVQGLLKLSELCEIDKSIEINYFTALSLARLGKREEAIFLLSRVLEAIPGHSKARALLAELKKG